MSDPHFWLDPVYAQTIVESVRAGLTQADPAHAGAYARNAAAYNVALQRLDQEFAAGLKTCQTRTIVTSHAAFGYLAKRYDLQVIPIAGVSPEDEPSAAALARISELVKAEHIKVVFFERLASPRLADTIARETGAQTAVFDPIEGLDDAAQKAGDTYVTIQHSNLGALRNALSCR
jgi:zinc transport system substrate-binding protein